MKHCCSNRENVVQELRRTRLKKRKNQRAHATKLLLDGKTKAIEDAKPRPEKDILAKHGHLRSHRSIKTRQRRSQQQVSHRTTAEIQMASQQSGVIPLIRTRDGTTVIRSATRRIKNLRVLRQRRTRRSSSAQEDGTAQYQKVRDMFPPKIIIFMAVHTNPSER